MNKKIKVLVFGLTALLSLNLISCKTKTEDIKETVAIGDSDSSGLTYPLVDTNQGLCFDNSQQIEAPEKGEAFYGQDAQYTGNVPSYTDNGDGTVTDNVTGLI
ncbi:MAG: hypothetical protein M0P10_11735 [Sphaerochaetaceae bacterium]|jgi:hypothetical protein|nr:hypothetical protein [Sphaerochaetaceae bacterium]